MRITRRRRQEGYQRSDISDLEAGIEMRKAKFEVRYRDGAAIPPLRGPTRQKAARKRKSGRSGRDDNPCRTNRQGHPAERREKLNAEVTEGPQRERRLLATGEEVSPQRAQREEEEGKKGKEGKKERRKEGKKEREGIRRRGRFGGCVCRGGRWRGSDRRGRGRIRGR